MSGCRGCGRQRLQRVLDLGAVPAADHFPPLTEEIRADEASYPLAMDLCAECGLAQLAQDDTVTAEPRGVEPQALRDQAADAVARVAEAGWLTGKTVREFGSPHGGSWLGLLAERGFTAITGPVGTAATGTVGTAATGTVGTADVVLDCFGIMHEPDQRAAFAERAASTAAGGVLLLQYHTLSAIVAEGQWNALRHGHFAYYSAAALDRLLGEAGMTVVDTWHFDLYGGTVLVAAVHTPDGAAGGTVRTADPATESLKNGALQRAADTQLQRLHGWLLARHRDGLRVYGYSAASRAVALFALAGLDRTLIGAVADASPAKQGRRMPGTDIAVISPEQLVDANPDLVVLTLPDLLDEVSAQLPELAGRWVVLDGLPE